MDKRTAENVKAYVEEAKAHVIQERSTACQICPVSGAVLSKISFSVCHGIGGS